MKKIIIKKSDKKEVQGPDRSYKGKIKTDDKKRKSFPVRGNNDDLHEKKKSFPDKRDPKKIGLNDQSRKRIFRGENSEKTEFAKKVTTDKKNNSDRPNNSLTGTVRLNKYIANAGICSRREADKLIESGAVSVNGVIVTEMGIKVRPSDIIQFGGQTLKSEKFRYILLNKPKDYITTLEDPEDRKTVMNLIKDACKERIYPVGRLDRNTTGLLLFTNDGDLAKKLTHPKYNIKKIYHVELDKKLVKEDILKIIEGVELDDGFIKIDRIEYAGDGEDKKVIGVEIHSGKNRIVRRIFEHFGYNVKKLDRTVFAGLTKLNLPRGRWRFLTEEEVNILRRIR